MTIFYLILHTEEICGFSWEKLPYVSTLEATPCLCKKWNQGLRELQNFVTRTFTHAKVFTSYCLNNKSLAPPKFINFKCQQSSFLSGNLSLLIFFFFWGDFRKASLAPNVYEQFHFAVSCSLASPPWDKVLAFSWHCWRPSAGTLHCVVTLHLIPRTCSMHLPAALLKTACCYFVK